CTLRIIKSGRHNAHYSSADSVESDLFVNDVRLTTESSRPESIFNDHDCIFSRLIFFSKKRPTHHGLNSGSIEETVSNKKTLKPFRCFSAGKVWTPPSI